jgi:biotin/methionine sulfoxide reductase
VATALERDDFAAAPSDLWISAMHKAVEPPAGVLTDYEVFAAVSERLGFGKDFSDGREAGEWIRHLYACTRERLADRGVMIPAFDEFWGAGRVGLPNRPISQEGSFAALRADPDSNPLSTPSGRIELFSETIDGFAYDDCPGHPVWLEPAEWLGAPLADRLPLHLISNQPRTRLHSQYDNGGASQASKIATREPLTMHPADAGERAIADGDVVRVFNDRGACLAGAVLSEGIRRGVVQIATGAWFDPMLAGAAGSLERHGNPNVLTMDTGTSRLAQGSSALTALVQVEKADERDLPSVEAFAPPLVKLAAGQEAPRPALPGRN